jgi:hypothetical protein
MQKGVYSDKAFSYLLGQLNPTTRDSLIYGKRGGLVPRNVAFQRVRAQVEFERRVIPGETWSVSHWGSAPARTAGVSVNLLMLAIELWNDIGQPLLEAHRTSVQIKEATQIVPFLRRVIFWQTMGAQCLYTGVNDPTFGSPSYITNPEEINKQINDLDGLFMQSPGLTDGDILRVAAWLTYNVRNYDEFAMLFIDSKQDAVRWEIGAGESWDNAKWKIKTGYYETSGSNHVEEKWEDNPKLTQFMQKLTSMIVSNTSILLGEFGTGKPTPEEMTRKIGALPIDGPPLYRARLRVKSDSTPASVPVVAESETSGPALKVTLKWWSEPEFYVLAERETSLMVTGADYNTYALIRKQESEKRTLYIGGYEGYTWTARSRIGNEGAAVWIAKDLLERTPEAAANTPAAQPNSGTAATPTNLPAPTTPPAPVQSTTGKDVAPRKGGVDFGPQTFQKPGPDAGKDDNTLPGAKIRF